MRFQLISISCVVSTGQVSGDAIYAPPPPPQSQAQSQSQSQFPVWNDEWAQLTYEGFNRYGKPTHAIRALN